MIRGPVWRGPQAAGKRHSQPFSAKRLPHAWLGSSPTVNGTVARARGGEGPPSGISKNHLVPRWGCTLAGRVPRCGCTVPR